jgi:hypothetical protein
LFKKLLLFRFCRHVRYLTNAEELGMSTNHPDAILNFDPIESDDDEQVLPTGPPIVPVRIGTRTLNQHQSSSQSTTSQIASVIRKQVHSQATTK